MPTIIKPISELRNYNRILWEVRADFLKKFVFYLPEETIWLYLQWIRINRKSNSLRNFCEYLKENR